MTEEEKRLKELEQQNAVEQQAEPAAAVAEQTTEQPQPSAYDRLMAAYEERQKKDERADKRDRIRTAIAGIGDTVGALGNLYFTTKYASPIPQTEGMSDKMRERYEAAKAKRDRNRAEWMNYALNIAGRKQAEEQAEASNQLRAAAAEESKRQFDERMNFYREQEERRKAENEFKQQKEAWRQDFEAKKLDQKEQLAKMNADLKRWSERLKMSRSEVAHTLAGYTIDEYEYRDEQGRKHKVKVRTVYNPKTEQLETKETDEVQQSSQQDTQQSGGKSLGIGVQSAKPAGKSLGIKVK